MFDLNKLHAGISEITSIPPDELSANTALETCENWDSLAQISTVALIFETARVSVSHDEIFGIVTLQDIFDLVTRKVQEAR